MQRKIGKTSFGFFYLSIINHQIAPDLKQEPLLKDLFDKHNVDLYNVVSNNDMK